MVRHLKAIRHRPAFTAAALCLLAAAAALVSVRLFIPRARFTPQVEVAAPPVSTMERTSGTRAPAPRPRPTATAVPEASPLPGIRRSDGATASLALQAAAPGPDYADPGRNRLITATRVHREKSDNPFYDVDDIHMPDSGAYASLEGVTTFRGSNYRDGGAWGTIPEAPTALEVQWTRRIGEIDEWTGVGWTGQGSIVRWPAETRRQMNIRAAKRDKDGLTEVIYATLDGRIYFLDLEDGEKTRSPIDIGAPIKGSLSVDPRGIPILYCGQGIYEVGGKRVPCGTRIWSLVDQSPLFFLDGKDPKALRAWAAFDCSPLVDGESDTMITAGENGVVYKVRLNTRWESGQVTLDPEVTRYVYSQARDGKLGTENSVAVYNHYAYFATNIGIIQCVDLNDMSLVWSVDAQDDIDASLVIEPESDGLVALYAVNELDDRGTYGKCQMFKLNALTGELLWKRDSDPLHTRDDNGSGGFGTPALGKGSLSDLIYFHVCRTKDTKGMLYALDKATGETVWAVNLTSYGWSSPTCVYTPSGRGYVLVGSSSGVLRLLDGRTGEEAARVKLQGNIEGTPAVFDDWIVVGTRSNRIYGIRIL